MKKLLVAAGFVAALLFGSASAASAAGQVCYSVQVNAQGSSFVSESGCQALP